MHGWERIRWLTVGWLNCLNACPTERSEGGTMVSWFGSLHLYAYNIQPDSKLKTPDNLLIQFDN